MRELINNSSYHKNDKNSLLSLKMTDENFHFCKVDYRILYLDFAIKQ